MVAISIHPGTYLDRLEQENVALTGGFEIDDATSPLLINNTVVGAERFGYMTKGEPCDEEATWSGNVVHSAWMGVSLVKAIPGCTQVANFEVYKCANYGIYAQVSHQCNLN